MCVGPIGQANRSSRRIFGGIRFYRPIIIGQVIETTARLIHTGPRSMHLSVHVTATDTNADEPTLAAHGLAVFVALDDEGKARPVRSWTPASTEDRLLDQHARHLIELRAQLEPFTSASTVPADAEPNHFSMSPMSG